MRILFSTLLFFQILLSYGQAINYCEYLNLKVSSEQRDGKLLTRYWYETAANRKDAFASFLKSHEDRFHYLLYNRMEAMDRVIDLYPDTIRMNEAFCSAISDNNKVHTYFINLTPANLTTWNTARETFTVDDMMMVASRFFFCSGVDKADTTLETHICLGISGQDELKTERDLTLLEAFIFEAIFSYLKGKKDPRFVKNFYNHAKHSGKRLRNEFNGWDQFLTSARNDCYEKMMEDADLRRKLLRYYRKNQPNLNFIIESTYGCLKVPEN